VAQILSLQPEERLKENHSTNKGSNNAVSSAYEFCADLNRVNVIVVSFENTACEKESNCRDKEKAGSYFKIMQAAVVPIINPCANFVLVVVLGRAKTNKLISLHNVYQPNSRCDARKYACI
jgi:hypothetical protein